MVTAARTGVRGLAAAAGTAWGGGTEEPSPEAEGRGGLISGFYSSGRKELLRGSDGSQLRAGNERTSARFAAAGCLNRLCISKDDNLS